MCKKSFMRFFVIFLLLGCATGAFAADVSINSENFPDENFRAYVSSDIDTNHDGVLSDSEILSADQINVGERSIESLKGIEYFTSMTWLGIWSNYITELDLSQNTLVEYIDAADNQLTAIDLSSNPALVELELDGNSITSLDLSANTKLEYLYIHDNNLENLILSDGLPLKSLTCPSNKLTNLDVSGLTGLISFDCSNNNLTALDVSSSSSTLEDVNFWGQIFSTDIYQTGESEYTFDFTTISIDAETLNSKVQSIEFKDSDDVNIEIYASDGSSLTVASQPSKLTYEYVTGLSSSPMPVTLAFTNVIVSYDSSASDGEDSNSGNDSTPSEDSEENSSDSNQNSESGSDSEENSNSTDTPAEDSEESESESGNGGSTTNNNSLPESGTATKEWRYQNFEISSNMYSALMSKFGLSNSSSIRQFSSSEIDDETVWTVTSSDTSAINDIGETVIATLPVMRPSYSGVYVMHYTLGGATSGDVLHMHNVSSGNSVNASAVSEIQHAFYNEGGTEISQVPSDGYIYAAMNLTAGTEYHGVITTEFSTATISPVISDDELLTNIVKNVAPITEKTQVKFITQENISTDEAPAPSQEILDEAKSNDHEILGSIGTVNVDTNDYYVFKVTLSDDVYEQIKGVNVDNLKVYVSSDKSFEGNSDIDLIQSSFFLGLFNTIELLTMKGEKLEFGAKEFLMVGLLNSGQPLTLFIAKLILSLLFGGVGCNAGAGIIACGVLLTFLIIKRRR